MVKIYSGAVQGIEASLVTVEVAGTNTQRDILVGLPDSAVRESLMRVYTAIKNTGISAFKKMLVNLSPADVKKEGTAYDLPIAIGKLMLSDQIDVEKADDYLIMGELSLDGTLQPIKGALPITLEAKKHGFKGVVLPELNAEQVAVVDGVEVYGFKHLTDVVSFFRGNDGSEPLPYVDYNSISSSSEIEKDFRDVKGQLKVKRAMEIAAAGGHNVILIGPPGAGKTMLARRLPTILPNLTLDEALETTKIHSVSGNKKQQTNLITQRPFRSPHHTISNVALVGGGSNPAPGEISMAHNGVLFLDELTEFKRTVLEVMRQPLEEKVISINRAKFSVDYPANFMLIASMNPCPCGYFNHPDKDCVCPPGAVKKYLNKISGPLLDRIDLHVEVTPVGFQELNSEQELESSSEVKSRVVNARNMQEHRFKGSANFSNSTMSSQQIKDNCKLNESSKAILAKAMQRLGLSARAYDRIKKVARTIADLEGEPEISPKHISEAINYRSLDRKDWSEN